jgi:hypothetical protein
MKKHDYITVLGTNKVAISPIKLAEYGPIITVNNKGLSFSHIDYVWVREEVNLIAAVQPTTGCQHSRSDLGLAVSSGTVQQEVDVGGL